MLQMSTSPPRMPGAKMTIELNGGPSDTELKLHKGLCHLANAPHTQGICVVSTCLYIKMIANLYSFKFDANFPS